MKDLPELSRNKWEYARLTGGFNQADLLGARNKTSFWNARVLIKPASQRNRRASTPEGGKQLVEDIDW